MTQDLQTVRLPGGRLQYIDHGPRGGDRVLILVHGFPLGVGMWAPQHDAFPEWRVIVPALPGFDGSDSPATATVDAYASAVIALLDRLEIEAAAVCGLSMGGYVSFGIMRQAAPRVSRLILADTRSSPDSDEAKAGRRRLLEVLDREGQRGVARELMPKLVGQTTAAAHPEVGDTLAGLIERQPRETIASAVQALMERPDSSGLLPSITVPTLVIVGEEDTLTPPGESEWMHRAMPQSSLVRIPRAGHMANMEQPAAFNEAVRQFLA